MASPNPTTGSDPLEEAHLAYIRGDFAEARSILEIILAADPYNGSALQLRTLAERAAVERVRAALRSECWLTRRQPSVIEFLGVLALGLLLVAFGAAVGAGPLGYALTHGFFAPVRYEVGYVRRNANPADYTLPAHFVLLFPLAVFSLGVFLVHSCVRHLRSLRD